MHIGGDNRRGELSDKFIDPAIEFSDYIIVVESGNKDNYFTDFASINNIPLEQVSSIADVIEPLEKHLNKYNRGDLSPLLLIGGNWIANRIYYIYIHGSSVYGWSFSSKTSSEYFNGIGLNSWCLSWWIWSTY